MAPAAGRRSQQGSPFVAPAYTLDLILAVGDFGQQSAYHPRGATVWLAYMLIVAGLMAGRRDEARERLEDSSRLRREVGAWPGVAANMVGLVSIAAAQDRRADATATLGEAHELAGAHGAHAIVRQIEQARTEI